ncbi:MAG: HNH endonuclease [Proteobacteria bacterium]|nr:HNH endonuclease [Pseudomonadota bacterium]NBP12999.1 HNH endonuclease [bacterium]
MKQNHKNKITDEQLIEAFKESSHIGKVSVKFNLPTITIWRRLKKLGIELKTIKNNVKIPIQEILEGKHPYYQTFKLNRRLIKENILENKCSVCNINSWNGKPIRLHLDHINGISSDHTLKNLRLICPNCHSQTETYCGKNK